MASLLLFILDVITLIVAIGVVVVAGTILYTLYKGGDYNEIIENLNQVKTFTLNLLQRGEKVAARSGEYTKLTASILTLKKERRDKILELGELILKLAKKVELPEEAQEIIAQIASIEKEINKLEKQRKKISEKILSEE